MKVQITIPAFLLFICLQFIAAFPLFAQHSEKPRVIVTTDGEIDDRFSMIRFLMYANEFEVESIVHSSSKFHWKGNEQVEGYLWNDVSWLDHYLDVYDQVLPNLLLHSPEYPAADDLRKKVYVGNIEQAGEMEEETAGSNHIVEVLLDPDPSPIWLQAWGGSNTIARALKTIDEEYPERKDEVAKKAKLFLILLQDTTYETYIKPHWPELSTLLSTAFPSIGYPWKKHVPEALHRFYSASWMDEHVLVNHGPLMDIYRESLHKARQSSAFISEGDSPAFMHEIHTGLRSTEDPEWGGWGGRFVYENGTWVSAEDDGNIYKSIYRWIPAYQHDWAARADWCVSAAFEQANHPPLVALDCDEKLLKSAGSQITISAAASSDPDGDTLHFKWWVYSEVGTYAGQVDLQATDGEQISFKLPADMSSGDTIHLICEVSDDGEPSLTRYKRVIIEAK